MFPDPGNLANKLEMLENLRRWIASHPQWTLVLATVGALLPFIGKPFNIDDPLFVWASHQIQAHPGNPYGFNVEWDWRAAPMWKVTENPPLACYYLALASCLLGGSEIALHVAFLLPAVLAILGTYRLAKHFCNSPMLAALATLFTPAFLVSSTTVMSDVPMLAFWVWAVVFWVEGQTHYPKLVAAACLAALAEVTKYYGVCLMPLLAAYSVVANKNFVRQIVLLLIPLAAFGVYQLGMHHLYGAFPLMRALDYTFSGWGSSLYASSLFGLAFIGGCVATLFFLAIPLWKKRAAIIPAGVVLAAVIFFLSPGLFKHYPSLEGAVIPGVKIQLAFWATIGVSALALAVADFIAHRDAKSVLLVLWLAGTFIFASFLNWTINARSVLPMVPAAGILVARRLEHNSQVRSWPMLPISVCVALSAILAMLAAEADCVTAFAVRQNVRAIYAACGPNIRQVHFQGHWGFQYYMQQLGAMPLDLRNDRLKPGDVIALPLGNTMIFPPAAGKAVLLSTFTEPGPPLLNTMDDTIGAGFYADIIGPLPFAFGPVAPEKVYLFYLQ